jgi:LysR family transcriptional regulator, nitrogen assimilation regulatory protein
MACDGHLATMELKQLRALVAVADAGSVTRAATVLNLVQPAVTRQLQLLESQLGTPLFDRSRHGMQLTEAGATLVGHARRILEQVARARTEVIPTTGPVTGVATVGLLASTAELLATDLIAAVAAQYPGIRLRIAVGYSSHLLQWLQQGEIDLGLLYGPQDAANLISTPLVEEALWAVAPPGTRLRSPVRLSRLAREPFILPAGMQGLRGMIEYAAASQRVQLQPVAETNDLGVQKRLVMEGRGWTILPAVAVAQDVATGRLCAAALSQPAMHRKVVLSMSAHRGQASVVRCAAAVLEERIRSAVEKGRWPGSRLLHNA